MINRKSLAAVIILISVLTIVYQYHNYKASGSNRWLKYTNREFGIEFEYPEELKYFETDTITFRDCDECPGIIHVEKHAVNSLDIREAMTERGYEKSNIIGETQIDDIDAVITTPLDSESKNQTDKAVLFIKNNELYRISYRAQQIERFWKSIRLP